MLWSVHESWVLNGTVCSKSTHIVALSLFLAFLHSFFMLCHHSCTYSLSLEPFFLCQKQSLQFPSHYLMQLQFETLISGCGGLRGKWVGVGSCAAFGALTGEATWWFAVVVTAASHLLVLLASACTPTHPVSTTVGETSQMQHRINKCVS